MKAKTIVTLTDAKKEYITWFIKWRDKWTEFQKSDEHTPGEVEYCYRQMKKYAALIDLSTRLQNELKGQTR